MKIRFSIAICLASVLSLLFALPSEAVEVTRDQAKTAAFNWVRRNRKPLTSSFASERARRHRTYETKNGAIAYHVVDLEEGGYVILSGDTRLSPIIAFSGEGEFDDAGENPLRARLDAIWTGIDASMPMQKITPAAGVGGGQNTEEEREWAELLSEDSDIVAAQSYASISDVCVAPLVQSKWGQSTWPGTNLMVFNRYTPGNSVCGCVATAFAQVMRYWCAPRDSVAPGKYMCSYNGASQYLTMKGGVYDWSLMPLSSSQVARPTTAQCEAIGKLVSDIGIACYMEYTTSDEGSGTLGVYGSKALKDRFGYASANSVMNIRDNLNVYPNQLTSDMRDAILASLDAGMPVVISIVRSGGGHETVLDGYGYYSGKIYLHMNCGWSGSQDLWYNLMGERLTSQAYDVLQDVTFNIHPSRTGEIISGRVTDASGNPVEGASVEISAPRGNGLYIRTNAKGIYYFRTELTGTYNISASSGDLSGSTSVTMRSLSSSFTFNGNGGIADCGTVGNKWGNDIVLKATPIQNAPANDKFSAAQVILGTSGLVTGSNVGATIESGEPLVNSFTRTSASVWWSWIAPASGTASFSTDGTSFDTLLGVYTGSTLSSLKRVVENDDLGSSKQSRCDFVCTAGTRYYIAVAGYGSSAVGNISLRWSIEQTAVRPLNDNFANATEITGESGSSTGTTLNATTQTNDLLTQCYPQSTNSVWWSWVAPSDGRVTFDTTGSSIDTVMVAAEGSVLSSLTLKGSNDDEASGIRTSRVAFSCSAGSRYAIAIGGYRSNGGAVKLNWSLERTITRPANDAFSNALKISGITGSSTGTNVNATRESAEQALPFGVFTTNTVWWTWTAPSAGSVQIDTIGSSFDTVLVVYTGTSVGNLTVVASDDDGGGAARTSVCRFDCTAGGVYRICVAGYNGRTGNISLQWHLTVSTLKAYTIRYHKNDGGLLDHLATQTVTCDESEKLRTVQQQLGWTRSGYIFVGWASSESSRVISYSDGQSIKNLATAGSTINLYAIWQVSTLIAEALNTTDCDFVLDGAAWFAQTSVTHDNAMALQSGKIDNNESCSVSTTVAGPGVISFWWYVSSELNFDYLEFIIDGEVKDSISGQNNSWAQKTYSIASGSHTLQWRYKKNASAKYGLDAGFVDQVVWTPSVSLSSISIIGQDHVFAGMTSQFNAMAKKIDGSIWEIVPTWSIVSGASYASISPVGVLTGKNVTSKQSVTIRASYTEGSVTKEATQVVTVYPTFSLQTALDNSTLTFTTGGNANWFGQGKTTYDGTDAARSGIIVENQNSWMQTEVTGPGTVSFRWYASSEVGTSGWYDYLTFSINGVQTNRIGGTSCSWTKCSYTLGEGRHVLRWNYLKDGSSDRGEDAGFVDQVVWTPSNAPGVSGNYSIRFIRNDGAGTLATNVFAYGVSVNLPTVAKLGFARRGYMFGGWATTTANARNGIAWMQDGAAVKNATTVGKMIDVYAIWKLKSDYYEIRFEKNDGSGKWRALGYEYGKSTALPSHDAGLGWSRAGYTFKGWATSATGAVWKTDKAAVSTAAARGKTLVVYAIWEKISPTYSIRFIRNDGAGTLATDVFTYGVSVNLPTVAKLGFARRGYMFGGWATTTANARNGIAWKQDGAVVKNATTVGKMIDVYAIWKLKSDYYEIRFEKNDGSGKWRALGYEYGKSTALPSHDAGLGWSRAGYTFKGWATSATGAVWKTDKAAVSTAAAKGKTLVVYAIWKKTAVTSVMATAPCYNSLSVVPEAEKQPAYLTGELVTGDGVYYLDLDEGRMTGLLWIRKDNGETCYEIVTLMSDDDFIVAETEGGEVYWLAK